MPDDFGVMQYRKAIVQARGRMMCSVICHGSGGVDGVLVRRGVATLSHTELTEACLDRGFGSTSLSDDEMRKLLSGWLQLVDKRRFDCELEPHRLRLAAMAACATTSVRRQKESLSVLPRLLLA